MRWSAAVTHGDRGFTLVEVLVALILLSVALTALAGLSYQVGLRATDAAGDAHVSGVITDEIGYLATVPFDSLPGEAGCRLVTGAAFQHIRCVKINELSARTREVTLVVTPRVSLMSPDTLVFLRSRPIGPNPFTGS